MEARNAKKKNTKVSKTNDDWKVADAILAELKEYAKERNQKENIEYSITEDNGNFRIKIIKDPENILSNYLDAIE